MVCWKASDFHLAKQRGHCVVFLPLVSVASCRLIKSHSGAFKMKSQGLKQLVYWAEFWLRVILPNWGILVSKKTNLFADSVTHSLCWALIISQQGEDKQFRLPSNIHNPFLFADLPDGREESGTLRVFKEPKGSIDQRRWGKWVCWRMKRCLYIIIISMTILQWWS